MERKIFISIVILASTGIIQSSYINNGYYKAFDNDLEKGRKNYDEEQYCYECSSKSALCRHSVYDGQYLTKTLCSSPCFLRYEGDTIYRGCFDGWRGGLVKKNYLGCRVQEYLGDKVEWCFCNSYDNEPCNGASHEAMEKMAPTSASDLQQDDVAVGPGDARMAKLDSEFNSVYDTKYFLPTPSSTEKLVEENDVNIELAYEDIPSQDSGSSNHFSEIDWSSEGIASLDDRYAKSLSDKYSTSFDHNYPASLDDKYTARSAITKKVDCFSCHDSSPYCKERVTKAAYLTITKCKTKCFIRKERDKIYRGCFDGWVGTKVQTDYTGCKQQYYMHTDVNWCFCDKNFCNAASMSEMGQTTSGHESYLNNDHYNKYFDQNSDAKEAKIEEEIMEDAVQDTEIYEAAPTPRAPSGGTVVGMCRGHHDGVYADPFDCTRFVHCFNGFTYRRLCPPGTVWNEDRKNCDYPHNAGAKCVPNGYGSDFLMFPALTYQDTES